MIYYLIGSNGRLGQAVRKTLIHDDLVCLDRSIYQNWSNSGSSDKVSKYFELNKKTQATILVASGLLDPTASREDLISVNHLLPKNIIDGTTKLGFRVITFGTIMEELVSSKNRYVQSKTLLNHYVKSLNSQHNSVAHIQLHTLYGVGAPSPFMFLGQILSALRNDSVFEMTSGCQLREYHHFLDDTEAIKQILESQTTGVVNLSNGKPVTLREIAQQVFSAFCKSHLLKIGALPDPPEENYDTKKMESHFVKNITFRDTLTGVVDYMKTCCSFKE